MKNLEHYANLLDTDNMLCYNAYICKHGRTCDGVMCRECELCGNTQECIKVMLADYQEPIKLKQWEKDLLACCVDTNCRFEYYKHFKDMKEKGYYRGITDTSMRVGGNPR